MANLSALTSVITHTSQLYGQFSTTFEVVALGNDKYVLTYGAGNSWNFTEGSGSDIRAEIWNMNGTQAVSHFFIPTIRGGDQQDLSVVETPGGGFTAAWSAQLIQTNGAYNLGNLGPQDSVRMARFGVDGARIGVEVAFEPGGTLPNWNGVAIAYSDNVNTSFPLVAASAFGSTLSPNSTEMIIMSEMAPHFVGYGGERAGSQLGYQLTERTGPALTISWHEIIGGQGFIKGGIINGINQPIYAEWLVPLTNDGVSGLDYYQDRAYEVTVLTTGETVVGYDDDYGGGLVKFRIFNPDGSGGGTPLYVSVDESTEAFNAPEDGIAVHALNDGGFVAAWQQSGYTNAAGGLVASGLYMRTYNALGNATGSATLVKQDAGSVGYVDIDIDVGDDGAIVVGWMEYSSNSGIGGTYSRVFREQIAVTGTADADVLSGTINPEAFAGLGNFDIVSYALAAAPVTASLAAPAGNLGAASGDTFASIEGLTGGAFADVLTGDANANRLTGNAGNDTLDGGAGDDTLDGGDNDDTYFIDSFGDTIVDLGGSNDRVITSLASFTLSGSVEHLDGTAATGQALTGNNSSNIITGGIGNDTLAGFSGNDTLIGGMGADSMNGGLGVDLLSYELTTTAMTVTMSGVWSIVGSAHATGDVISGFEGIRTGSGADSITGSTNADRIEAGNGNDTLNGGTGNDTLDGGAGADAMAGGANNDTYVVDNASDVTTEALNAGTDLVQSTINHTLRVNVENLTLIGTGNTTGIGNTLANTLVGNGGNNILDGGTGADAMRGGAGNDRYTFDDAGDTASELVGEGTDTVISSVAHTLRPNFENLTIIGAATNAFGSSVANVLTGSALNNLLNGKEASDILTGGAGLDTFMFDTALGATNVDRITDFNPVDDAIRLDDAIFSALPLGTLAAGAFHAGTAAADGAHRIIYDQATGRVFYDADGLGGTAQVLFALLDTKPLGLSNLDFVIT